MQQSTNSPAVGSRLCVFPQLQETVGAENFIAISCQHHCHVFMSSAQCLSAKRVFSFALQRSVSCYIGALRIKYHDLFQGQPFNNNDNNNNNTEKLQEHLQSPTILHKALIPPAARSVGCLLLPSETFSGACPQLPQGHILPWEHSMSNACSVGGGRKPGKGVGPTLWSSPQE